MNREQVQERLEDIVAITLAAFDPDDQIDAAGVEANISHLVDGGVRALVAAGNTTEFYTLSPAEHAEIVHLTAKLVDLSDVLLIAGIGHDVDTAVAAARAAADVGAQAVMVHDPPHPHVTEEGVIAYYEAIAGGSRLPLIPYISRSWLSVETIVSLVERVQPVGVKFAINDLPKLGRTVRADASRDTAWVCGTAERWAPFFWTAGVRGFTSGVVNVTTEPSRRMLEALRAANTSAAMDAWAQLEPFERLRARQQDGFNVAVVKEAVRQLGRPAGPVRPPASDLPAEERETVAQMLRAWGLL